MLQYLPISFRGILNEVKLVAFSVELDEITPYLPDPLRPLSMGGRALITMVNVKLKEMRPKGLPAQTGFDYQHLAFRLAIDDRHLHNGVSKGIYFLESFADKPWVKMAGNLTSRFRFSPANIKDEGYLCEFQSKDRFFHYAYSTTQPETPNRSLFRLVKRLDRAYAEDLGRVYCTQVLRNKWPIQWGNLYHLETNFFESAKPEGMFTISEPVPYTWKAPQKMPVTAWNANEQVHLQAVN